MGRRRAADELKRERGAAFPFVGISRSVVVPCEAEEIEKWKNCECAVS